MDRSAQNSGSGEVRTGQAFDVAALDSWLADHIEGYVGPLTVEQFRGGQSNPTYKLITPGRAYVMRRKPSGKLLPGAHAIEREYRVITALGRQGFPVAKSYGLCEDEGVIGTAFYVMEMVEGRITRFAAVFHSRDSDPVGPIRSGRSQDVDLLTALRQPLFAWSGGNPGVTWFQLGFPIERHVVAAGR